MSDENKKDIAAESNEQSDAAQQQETPAQEITPAAAPTSEAEAPATPAPAAEASNTEASASVDDEKAAKAAAAAAAREARAKARAAQKAEGEEGGEEAAPKEPSPNQPKLDRLVQIIQQEVGIEAIEEAYINEMSAHTPTLTIKAELWSQVAELLKTNQELQLHYLRNISGVDKETHLESVYHLINLDQKQDYAVRVKADRETPMIPSVTPIWETANWNEREIYDLLGIVFTNHPDLRRIMMTDEWIGYPLRKDYEAFDPEV